MRNVSNRTWVILLSTFMLLVGVASFFVRYYRDGYDWLMFNGSPHIYSGVNPNIGTVCSREGSILLRMEDGREYCEDSLLRSSVIHLLGDRYGFIEAPVLSHYADRMIDYQTDSGLYDSREAVMKLSISETAQCEAERMMEGKKGTVAVYNFKTGEILCLVSTPNYDPDDVPDIEHDTTGKYEGAYINRCFRSSYTPGSVFKILTLSAAIEQLPDVEAFRYDCSGSAIIGGEYITCSAVHGIQDLRDCFRNSCNCAFAELTGRIGRETMTEYVKNAGLLSEYRIDGSTCTAGSFSVMDSSDGSFAWAGVGQYTDLINPCSFLVYMGMIANGGSAAIPYFVSEIRVGDEITYTAEKSMVSSGLKLETTWDIRGMMRENVVIKYGTDYFPNVNVCAKSGTAETGGEKANSMFAGFIDDERYPLAFIVVVESGGSGTKTAAPIAGAVLKACIS